MADLHSIAHELYGLPLAEFIATLERLLARRAIRVDRPMQPGDVKDTYASIDRLAALTGFAPRTGLAEGLAAFVAWYRDYYGAGGASSTAGATP